MSKCVKGGKGTKQTPHGQREKRGRIALHFFPTRLPRKEARVVIFVDRDRYPRSRRSSISLYFSLLFPRGFLYLQIFFRGATSTSGQEREDLTIIFPDRNQRSGPVLLLRDIFFPTMRSASWVPFICCAVLRFIFIPSGPLLTYLSPPLVTTRSTTTKGSFPRHDRCLVRVPTLTP